MAVGERVHEHPLMQNLARLLEANAGNQIFPDREIAEAFFHLNGHFRRVFGGEFGGQFGGFMVQALRDRQPRFRNSGRAGASFHLGLPLHPEFIKEARERKRLATGQVTGQILLFCEQPRKAGEI